MNHDKFNYARLDTSPTQIPDKDVDIGSLRNKPASPPYFDTFLEYRDEFNKLKGLGSWRTEEQRLRLGDLFFILYSTFSDSAYIWDRDQSEDVITAARDAFRRYQAWARSEEQQQ
jgi:hypothetical protein